MPPRELLRWHGDAGARAIAVQADVTLEDDVTRLFAVAVDALGPVRSLVSNAGATMHIGDLADTPVATIKAVLDVNLLSTILCARRAAQLMSTNWRRRGGCDRQRLIRSLHTGKCARVLHYAAAKAGVDALTVGLAKELAGDGVRVNAVAPGIALTEIHAGAGAPDRAQRLARQSAARPGRRCARMSPSRSHGCSVQRGRMSPGPCCASRVECRHCFG